NGGTITNAVFTLSQGITPVAGSVNYAGVSAIFNPTSSLAPSTIYTATITTAATDLAGVPLGAAVIWTFTTGTTPDTTHPTVTATVPIDGATNVAINQTIGATFSEDMDPSKITT